MFDYLYENKTVELKPLPDFLDIPPAAAFKNFIPLAWDEHCLECSAPECYSSCPMYEKNRNGKCKRTQYGIRRVYHQKDSIYSYGTQLKFRKWGKLFCLNSGKAYSTKYFKRYLPIYEKIRNLLFYIGLPLNGLLFLQTDFFAWVWHVLLVRQFKPELSEKSVADGLMISLFSHSEAPYDLIVDAMVYDSSPMARRSLHICHGLNQFFIPSDEISLNSKTYKFAVYPANNEEAEITFFILDKVVLEKQNDYIVSHPSLFMLSEFAPKVKCVVWDLDNTVWKGIVGEDGIEKIELRQEAVDAIHCLDERGILCSIASKNDYELAWKALEQFGLSDYFLYPQINWDPKSRNLYRIAEAININIDTFAFIDDSPAERLEVASLCPGVRVYGEDEISNMLSSSPFDVIVTEDSKKRRLYYKTEEARKKDRLEAKTDDYNQFLASCKYEAVLFTPTEEAEVDRCLELFLRTNQLNSSGRRLGTEEFMSLMQSGEYSVLAVSCRDKYGEYGIVGCFVLVPEKCLITDFVMSCRVAKRKIENAIVWNLLHYGDNQDMSEISIRYIATARNDVLLQTFKDMGGNWNEEQNKIVIKEKEIKDYDLVKVVRQK